MISRANISEDERYRYYLTRWWDTDLPRVLWVMLNPSTADAQTDDATIRRCNGFARRWGYGGIVVVNLYGLRATDPRQLWSAEDPIGPENEKYVGWELGWSLRPVVAAWGVNARPDRVEWFLRLARWAGAIVQCLGTTTSGAPRHPLRLAADTPLQPYPA